MNFFAFQLSVLRALRVLAVFFSAVIFVIIELHTRRILHAAVTRSPTDEWTAQQIPECFAKGDPWPVSQPAAGGKITSTPVLGGFHHRYAWAATSSH